MSASLEELMERYVDGDAAAFDALFAASEPVVRSALRRWLRAEAEIDEAVQLTFFKLHASRDRFRRGAQVLPWVVTIARNVAMDHHRRRRSTKPLGPEDEAALVAEEPEYRWDRAEADEVEAAVRAAVASLPPSLGEVVRLHKLEQKSMAEVAALLGLKEGAVRVRAHRGYKLLAEKLALLWAKRT